MAKGAAAKVRAVGGLPVHRDWALRASVCEGCPIRVVHERISYCGRPFLDQIRREESADGCGCPTHAKAKDPAEHCPLDVTNHPARHTAGQCSCKWCADRAYVTPIASVP